MSGDCEDPAAMASVRYARASGIPLVFLGVKG